MGLPEANLTIKDGGLGLVLGGGTKPVACVGTCSGGVANTVYAFSDPTTMQATLGTGPLVEAAAHVLALAKSVICVKVTSTTPGAAGAVTHVGPGTSVCTTTGSVPLDSYGVQALIVTGAPSPAAALATLKWSLDGGRTYSAEMALPTNGVYVIPNTGVTLNFSANNTLVAGDTYAFTTSGPAYNTTSFGAAVDALFADPQTWFLLFAVGVPADAAALQGLFAALDTKLAGAQNRFRFARGLIQAIDDTDANIKTAVASLSSTTVMVAAGFMALTSTINGYASKRPAATVIAGRAAKVKPSEDLGRVASGPLPGVVALYRDEFATPGLDDAGLATLRTHLGEPGFYVSQPRIKAPSGSDFQLLQYGRVMDLAAAAVRRGQLRFLNDTVEVYGLDASTEQRGRITEASARTVENWVLEQMWGALAGEVNDLSAVVDRTTNIISTGRLPVRYRVVPKAYAKNIEGEIALANPALTLV